MDKVPSEKGPVFARDEGRDCEMVNSGSSWTEGVRRGPRCDERWGGGCSGEQRLHYWFVFLTARLTCTYSHLMHLTHLTYTIQWLLVSPQSIASLSCQTCGGSSQLTYRVCVHVYVNLHVCPLVCVHDGGRGIEPPGRPDLPSSIVLVTSV